MKKNKFNKKKQNQNIKQNQKKEPWYNNTFFVLIMLITFFPLGLYLVLSNKRLKKELWPSLKIILIVLIGLIAFTLISSEWDKPELKVKDEMTYKINQEFSAKQLITDYVEEVSDNQTDLTQEDVVIVKYDKLDFTQPGTQEITFLVKDEAHNITTAHGKLIIEK